MATGSAASFTLAVVAVLATPGVAAAQQSVPCTAPPAVAVAAVEQRYRGVATFSSDFVETLIVKAYDQTVVSNGHVVFSRPASVDWTFTKPAGARVVSDGVQTTTYDAPSGRAFVQPVSQQSPYVAAFAFLGALGTTHTAFQLLCGVTMQFPGGNVIVAEPVVSTPAYTKILFYADAAAGDVRRVLLLDRQGNRNRFDFSAPKVNDPVAPNQFVFTPPAGVAVIFPPPSAQPPPIAAPAPR